MQTTLSPNSSVSTSSVMSAYISGQTAQAESQAQALLKVDPNNGPVLSVLARIAEERGDRERSLEFWGRAATAPGATSADWNSLGLARIGVGQISSASVAFEQAIRLDPKNVQALNNLALTCQDMGNVQRSNQLLLEAVRIQPNFATAHTNLGHLYRQCGLYAEAVLTYEKALRIDINSADATNGLGMALHEQGEVDRAADCYRRALQILPNYADASNNLATSYKEKGRLDDAVTQFRATLSVAPNHPHAIYNLSQFAAEGRYRFSPEELTRLKGLVAAERGTPLERSLICFAIAAVYDAQRHDDDAFSYYRLANELRKQSRPPGTEFVARKHDAMVDRIIALFDREYFRNVRDWGSPSRSLIFIVGMPRTGSTVLEQILATDSSVYASGERGDIQQIIDRHKRELGTSEAYLTRPFTSPVAARQAADSLLEVLNKVSNGASVVTIKTLENFPHLGLIATLFPDARIIYCKRDPLDVCVSCYFQNFSNVEFSWDLRDIAAYYRSYERLEAHWRQTLPIPIHGVCYEELLRDPERITKELFEYCGLQWNPGCLRFFENQGAVRTASTVQVRKPLTTKPIGRWKRYRAHLGPLIDGLGLRDSESSHMPVHVNSSEREIAPSIVS